MLTSTAFHCAYCIGNCTYRFLSLKARCGAYAFIDIRRSILCVAASSTRAAYLPNDTISALVLPSATAVLAQAEPPQNHRVAPLQYLRVCAAGSAQEHSASRVHQLKKASSVQGKHSTLLGVRPVCFAEASIKLAAAGCPAVFAP